MQPLVNVCPLLRPSCNNPACFPLFTMTAEQVHPVMTYIIFALMWVCGWLLTCLQPWLPVGFLLVPHTTPSSPCMPICIPCLYTYHIGPTPTPWPHTCCGQGGDTAVPRGGGGGGPPPVPPPPPPGGGDPPPPPRSWVHVGRDNTFRGMSAQLRRRSCQTSLAG